MERNKPVQMPYGGGNLALNYEIAHQYISQISTGIKYLEGKNERREDLIMQIPLPLRGVLVQIIASPFANNPFHSAGEEVKIFGVKCLPGYEARIVIYNPERSFYQKNSIAVIDFEVKAGICERPILRIVE
ncbi:hypothetical protein [Mucilaginibacter rubeus]|uniref:Uncharacterized protein n=1 Tax=Mucilaginibacter rubeus TaxID=2027860 RepID=A0A5C1I7U9_9SPHI|nr:hypothetical protein [Mucilaginibacter rubeus]QEM13460.1 hypothetical protein DEO27_026770 [Mucilaginibacter rubeus]